MTRRIAIVGTAPTSRHLAPVDDPAWEIWGCSPGNMGQIKRVSIWFELHALVSMTGAENAHFALPYFKWLNEQTFPVFMQELNQHVPRAIVYPLGDVVKEFGRNWFTSSIAYMMALAIMTMKPGDELGIFGVDMASTDEHYSAQRAGCLRFIEIARERQIVVRVPRESSLSKTAPLYGYSQASPFGRRMEAVEIQSKGALANLIGQRDRMNLEIAFFQGALEQVGYIRRTWVDGLNDAELNVDFSKVAEETAKALMISGSAVRAVPDMEEKAREAGAAAIPIQAAG